MAIGDVVQVLPSTIGGGRVTRPFKSLQIEPSGRNLRVGRELTAEQIMAIPIKNRRALVERGWIEVWAAKRHARATPTPAGVDRHVVQVGFGRHIFYNVIEGVKVNDTPLTKEEAMAMAGKTEPETEVAA
jgi:hypothetical protein